MFGPKRAFEDKCGAGVRQMSLAEVRNQWTPISHAERGPPEETTSDDKPPLSFLGRGARFAHRRDVDTHAKRQERITRQPPGWLFRRPKTRNVTPFSWTVLFPKVLETCWCWHRLLSFAYMRCVYTESVIFMCKGDDVAHVVPCVARTTAFSTGGDGAPALRCLHATLGIPL